MEGARSWLIRMSFRRLPLLVLSDEFGSLEDKYGLQFILGTPLGVADCGHNKIILVCRL